MLLVLCLGAAACQSGSQVQAGDYTAVVSRVVDGDTIVVVYPDGRTDKVRMIGVDTPETHKPGTPVQCYGPEAERFTRKALDGKGVRLELDRDERDRYERLLAYVYIDGKRFEDQLLQRGFARQLTIRPNNRYARDFLALETTAKRQARGLWKSC